MERLGPTYPRHIWAQRFGRRLLELQPSMSAHAAVKAAVDAFKDWSHLQPEEAVGRFLVEQDLQKDYGGECAYCLNVGARPPIRANFRHLLEANYLAEDILLHGDDSVKGAGVQRGHF